MRERPILFSAPMVRAILEGRKTQTRRVVKQQLRADTAGFLTGLEVDFLTHWPINGGDYTGPGISCPYGQPGDRLWVRETWCPANSENGPVVLFAADCDRRYLVDESYPVDYEKYPAGRSAWTAWAADVESGSTKDWRPSIHMPRWASRISLEITDVRVERLQDLSEADAIAEGVDPARGVLGDDDMMVPAIMSAHDMGNLDKPMMPAAIARFVLLWDSINGKNPGVTNWNANPWVWVVSFRRLTR